MVPETMTSMSYMCSKALSETGCGWTVLGTGLPSASLASGARSQYTLVLTSLKQTVNQQLR